MEILANNFANRTTSGFIEQIPMLEIKALGKIDLVHLSKTELSQRNAPIVQTGRALDLAIIGKGFFKVGMEREHGYTREGSIHISADNILVNKDGFPFIGSNGEQFIVPADAKEITVVASGEVIAHFEIGHETLGKLGVFLPLNNAPLEAKGNNIYSFAGELVEDYEVQTMSLVQSNVNDQDFFFYQILQQERVVEESIALISNSIQFDKYALELINR